MYKYLLGISFFLMTCAFAENDHCPEYCTLPSAKEEHALICHLCLDCKRLYHSLDCEGKNRAIELAKTCENKSLAIEQAAMEMACRQRDEYPNQKDYKKQIQERSGQNLYSERFGY
ncbi:MAG: hypothetical protein KR126chlam3_00802 [Chlamydiae bacterium]|nr:hypothetical protein [Chlamydiota bacterium]